MKRQPIKWDKISVKDMTSKGLTSRIYKEHLQFNKDEATRLGNELRTYFTKNLGMANKHMKRWSTSLSCRETSIKTTMRYDF